MATLNTKSFANLVQTFAAGVQARSTDLIDFSTGSILRAVDEADSGNALWLEALIIQVLAVTRAITSAGVDLDSFVAQFMPIVAGTITKILPYGTPRLQATFATGQVTF